MTPPVKRLRTVLVALAAAAPLLAPASARAQTWGQFGVDILPLPLGSYLFHPGGAVNDAGQVTGSRQVTVFGSSVFEAFLFDGADVQSLGRLTTSAQPSFGRGINNLGVVAGHARTNNTTTRAVISNGPGTPLQQIGTLGGNNSSAFGINDRGQVVGSSVNSGGSNEAFIYDPSAGMQGLGFLNPASASSGAVGINEAGQVTGNSLNLDGKREAFRWDASSGMQGLGFLDATRSNRDSQAFDINDSGQVVGDSRNASGNYQAFLSDGPGTEMQGLDLMGGDFGFARGISNAGQVVGRVGGGTVGGLRAVLWEGGTGHFLDALVGGGWTFSWAEAMSGAGTVLALGTNSTVNGGAGTWVVLRQSPATSVVPEPSTWLLLATGLVGIGVAARRRREGEGAEG